MYVKLFKKILDSSIWMEPPATKVVWLTLLAAMDQDGFAQFASVKNLAQRAVVTVDECKIALACLTNSDPDSSNPDHDGKRVERVPGGFVILNGPAYRAIKDKEAERQQTRERVRKYRNLKKHGNAESVTSPLHTVTNALPSSSSSSSSSLKDKEKLNKETVLNSAFEQFWKKYPKKKSPGHAKKAFAKHVKNEQILSAILEALDWQIKSEQWTKENGQFIPYPGTYLNRLMWLDEKEKPRVSKENAKRVPSGIVQNPREKELWDELTPEQQKDLIDEK